MLSEIRVHNFAIVENQSITLQEGMTVFTGETGAGKSLLLDAITLLLGAKANASLVRSGASSAEVEGVFDWSEFPDRIQLASEMGFHFDDAEELLVVRREISSTEKRRNRIWIQGKSATRAQLQKLLGNWVEISGQHEFLRLNKEEYILETLDQFASLKKEVENYRKKYQDFTKLKKQLLALEALESERNSVLDFRKFQIEEFEKAQVGPDLFAEEEELNAKRQNLSNVEKIRTSLQQVLQVFNPELVEGASPISGSLLEQVRGVNRELSSWSKLGAAYEKVASLSGEALSILLDLEALLNNLVENASADPEELEQTEERLSQIAKLKRKYNTDSQGLCHMLKDIRAELERVENASYELKKTRGQFEVLEKDLLGLAEKLHQKRIQFSKTFSQKWQEQIRSLGIKDAHIEMNVSPLKELCGTGLSKAQVYFSANNGSSLKLVSKVASGGELSRILLAMKYLISDRNSVGFYLFDEVDSGIGGETAHRVGQKLKFISNGNQVIVVSHLAQVAAYSDHHYFIEKLSNKKETKTKISSIVDQESKTKEIARMLGATSSKAAHALAAELLQEARRSE